MRRNHILKILLVVFFIGQACFNFALDPKKEIYLYKNDVWQMEDGLPQNSVYTIIQTRNCYLWFGTQEGLVRYNGVRFDVFDRDNTNSFKSNWITFLIEDREGTLWIGTNGGGILSFKNDIFKSYTKENGLWDNNIQRIMAASDGSIWIGTENGLNRFKDGIIESITLPEKSTSSFISAIFEDQKKQIWIGTDGGGLFLFKRDTSGFKASHSGLSDHNIRDILEDFAGNLWVATARAGLIRMQGKNKFYYTTKNGLSSNNILCLYEDRDRNLWVGTFGGGLNRLYGGKISVFNSKHGLSGDTVYAIYEDIESNLWIGTFNGGLNRLKDMKVTTYMPKHGLSNENIRGILQDNNGDLWICNESGVNTMTREGVFRNYTTKNGLGHNSVYSVCEDKNLNLWFGTLGGGISRYRNGQFKTYTTRDGLSSNFVRCIYADRKGDIWIGTHSGGLNCFSKNRFTIYKKENGLSHNRVSAIHEDKTGDLWVGTIGGGLNRFRDGKIEVFNKKNGFFSDVVLTIYEDKEGILWIGTYEGLVCLKNGNFFLITKKNGLFDYLIYVILEDKYRNFWMSCNKGIFRVNRQELEDCVDGKISHFDVVSFGLEDGMASIECNGVCQPAGWKTIDGKLWFPTIKGVVMVDPENIPVNKILPPVVIEKVVINKKDYPTNGEIVVSPGKRSMEINYAGLSYVESKKILYKYKLENFETEWIEAGTRRTAYYTNVPSGHYQFKVIACNNDGKWNKIGASFALYFKPYFYQTWWFYLLIIFLILFSAFGSYRLRVRQLNRRREELEKLVDKRTEQLEESKNELKDVNKKLEKLATSDGLTGISNYRRFLEFYDLEWRRAIRNINPISLILIDVDFFKNYNDTYGHQAGDDCLKKVAEVIDKAVKRAGDLVARYGGEEFIMVLSETKPEGAKHVAEKVRVAVESLNITHEESSVADCVTISLGCATIIPERKSDPSYFLKVADEALYKSKQNGRNQTTTVLTPS